MIEMAYDVRTLSSLSIYPFPCSMPMLLDLTERQSVTSCPHSDKASGLEEDLGSLSLIRDRSPVSSRGSSKGGLLSEACSVFQAIHQGLPVEEVRSSLLEGKLFRKSAYETRRKIWDSLKHRYLSVLPEWSLWSLAEASTYGQNSIEFRSLAYLYYVLRDHLVLKLLSSEIWPRWQQRLTLIDRADVLVFLSELQDDHSQILKWRESTRKKVASNMLSSLRDFGLLQGVQKKHIQQPAISSEAAFHLLCILMSEGRRGMSILEAPEWHIFLWSEVEVAMALGELSQKRWIRFEKAGRTVILELIRMPMM